MPRKERFQTRLDPDAAERVEQYRQEKDITQAEAVRRLLLEGLDAADDDEPSREEIAHDLQQINEQIDHADDEPTHTMNQASAVAIGTAALAAGLVVTVGTALPSNPSPLVLLGLLIGGLLLIGYGGRPLVSS
jgi:hypothetical protein